MSLITKHNYEAFLLDYVEGNLSAEHTAELMLFLENNPELKEDLEDFDLVTLEKEEVQFDEKEDLKISEESVSAVLFDDLAIAEIEGENSPEQSKAFHDYLAAHPEKQQDFAMYQKTKLRPALVRFNGKEALMQEEKRAIPLYWWYSAAAAVILIIFLLNGVFTNDTAPTQLELAGDDKIEQGTNQENNATEEQNTAEENTFVAEQNEVQEEVKEVVTPQNNTVKIRKNNNNANEPIIKKVPIHEEQPQEDVNKAFKEPSEEIMDSIAMTEPIEDFIADQVKITYDEEPENNTTTQANPEGKKNTKFDVVRAAVKQQLKGLFGNAKKDLEVLTASAGEALGGKK